MKDNNIYKADEHKVVVDERTGEATKLMRKHNAHTETDFFIMYLRPWLAASENDVSRKIKVFIHCIMCSSLSRASSADGEGNYFHVSDVIESVKKEDAVISDNNVRVSINRLCAEGFVVKAKKWDEKKDCFVETRGKYYINPKFGIKGKITEKTYLKLVIEKAPVRSK